MLHPSSVEKMLPKDPLILLSFVNTKLRDECDSLEELCAGYDVDASSLCAVLSALDYHYDPDKNQFV